VIASIRAPKDAIASATFQPTSAAIPIEDGQLLFLRPYRDAWPTSAAMAFATLTKPYCSNLLQSTTN